MTLGSTLGLYEVVTPRGVFYTDKTGSYLIFGATVVDSKTKVNLSQQRMDVLGAFEFKQLPFADAIKTVRGDGSRQMVTFEDPNCGYCKKLYHELTQLNNVTIYTFLMPILAPDSTDKSKQIWCAADRSKVWNDYMANNSALPAKKDCATPLDRNKALGQTLRINGTPAILFASNARIGGFSQVANIEAMLEPKSTK